MSLLEKALKSMEEPKKQKPEAEKPKKRLGISERKMDKNQTLDAIYKLGKENIDNITDVKLRSILEDIKVYSKRK